MYRDVSARARLDESALSVNLNARDDSGQVRKLQKLQPIEREQLHFETSALHISTTSRRPTFLHLTQE
jgi:hypothetical protein